MRSGGVNPHQPHRIRIPTEVENRICVYRPDRRLRYGMEKGIIVQLANIMLSDRLFRILLNSQCSRLRKLNNGLPQGSVLSCLLFNLYILDLPPAAARKFLYEDDMACAAQHKLFSEINARLDKDMADFIRFCKKKMATRT